MSQQVITEASAEEDRKILSYLREEVRLTESYTYEIRCEQANALEAYDGQSSEAPLIENGSKVVSRDVYEAVEAIVPNVVNVFKTGKQIFEFDPVAADDVELCKQENKFIKQELDRLGVYNVIDTAVRDAAIQKNGYAKVYWQQGTEATKERYENKTIDELNLILAGKGYQEGDYSCSFLGSFKS